MCIFLARVLIGHAVLNDVNGVFVLSFGRFERNFWFVEVIKRGEDIEAVLRGGYERFDALLS